MGQFLNCLGLLTKTTKEKNIDHRKSNKTFLMLLDDIWSTFTIIADFL